MCYYIIVSVLRVVFHRVCLKQVCLRSDDARLMDILCLMSKSLFFCLSGQQDELCRRAVLQQLITRF